MLLSPQLETGRVRILYHPSLKTRLPHRLFDLYDGPAKACLFPQKIPFPKLD